MNEIINLMKEYAEKHNIKEGVTIVLEDDGSGYLKEYDRESEGHILFVFMNTEELLDSLNKEK